MRTYFSMYFCIKSSIGSGPRVKLAGCKSALTLYPAKVYSTDRSKAVVLVLFLLFVALWFQHCFLFSIYVVMLAL